MRPSNRTPCLSLAVAIAALVADAGTLVASGGPAPLERLQARITRAATGARGVVGVGIKHLESGAEVYVNGDDAFPKGIRVDRPCQELILDYQGADTAKLKDLTLKEIRQATPRTGPQTDEARWAQDDRYAADPRDQATPRAFVTLLEKIWRGEAVDRASSDAILETMKRCTTGAARIKGLLPRDTVVAHKTGSMGGVFDDVGIIYLPDDMGHIAIAVLTRSARAQSADAEKAIAEIARFAFDYFYFTASAAFR